MGYMRNSQYFSSKATPQAENVCDKTILQFNKQNCGSNGNYPEVLIATQFEMTHSMGQKHLVLLKYPCISHPTCL